MSSTCINNRCPRKTLKLSPPGGRHSIPPKLKCPWSYGSSKLSIDHIPLCLYEYQVILTINKAIGLTQEVRSSYYLVV